MNSTSYRFGLSIFKGLATMNSMVMGGYLLCQLWGPEGPGEEGPLARDTQQDGRAVLRAQPNGVRWGVGLGGVHSSRAGMETE